MKPAVKTFESFRDSLLILVASFLCSSGCGTDPNAPKINQAEQATIEGTIKFEGNPIPLDSGVMFASRDMGTTGGGKVDALGNFNITPADPKRGLKAGRYHVTIRSPGPPPIEASTDSKEYQQAMSGGGPKSLKSKKDTESPLIPKKFTLIDTTPLVLEVKPGPNKFNDIDLAKIK